MSRNNHEVRSELTRNLGDIGMFVYGYTLSKSIRYKNKLKGLEGSQRDMPHIESEQIKESSIGYGYLSETVGLMCAAPLESLMHTSLNVNGLTYFVLASNNPKKRKNCIKRGFNKLVEMISSYEVTPAFVPSSVRV